MMGTWLYVMCIGSALLLFELPYIRADSHGDDGECPNYNFPKPCGAFVSCEPKECKCPTYVFGVTPSPITYWNDITRQSEGVPVEVARKVCEYAGKRCKFPYVPRKYCWDVEEGTSLGLNGQWFDGCLPVADIMERRKAYSFPKYGAFTLGSMIVFAREGSNITEDDIRNPLNDYKLAFSASTDNAITSVALDMFLKAGYFIKPQNLVPIHASIGEIGKALVAQLSECGPQGEDQVDLMIYSGAGIPAENGFIKVAEIPSDVMGAIMVRNDNDCLIDWWDAAYRRLICSDEYPALCEKWSKEIGSFVDGCLDRSFCNDGGKK